MQPQLNTTTAYTNTTNSNTNTTKSAIQIQATANANANASAMKKEKQPPSPSYSHVSLSIIGQDTVSIMQNCSQYYHCLGRCTAPYSALPLHIPSTSSSASSLASTRGKRQRNSSSREKDRSSLFNVVIAVTTAAAVLSSLSLPSPASALIIHHPFHPHHHTFHHFSSLSMSSSSSTSSSSSSSHSQLNMVSTATERLLHTQKSPIRAKKVTAATATTAATAHRTMRRTKPNGVASVSTTTATTTRTMPTIPHTDTTAIASDSPSFSLAKTAESLYNLPSYTETSEWQDFIAIPSPSPFVLDEVTTDRKSKQRRTDISTATETVFNTESETRNHNNIASKKTQTIKSQKPNSTTTSASNAAKIPSSTTHNHQTKPNAKSRSSTMPGFLYSDQTARHTAYRDGIRIAKKANSRNGNQVGAKRIERVGRNEGENRKRRKANSEAMYASSASVPDSLIAFTNEIHLEERITPKEEIELGTRTQEAIRLQKLYNSLVKDYGREPSDDEYCAAAGKINIQALQDAIQEGIHAKNQLVTSNLRMVQGVVNLYIRNGLGSQYNAGDLMQEGTVALIRAAEKFEPDRGFRFSTYAMYWIRAAVKRSQILQSRVISVPQRLHETHKKIVKIEYQLKKEMGRKPTKEELALACGITESQLERCRTALSQQCFSLDAEIVNTLKPNSGDKSSETSYNLFSAKYDDVELRELQSHFMKEDLVSTLKRYLSPHEVDLLLLRYGLMDERTMPYGFSGPLTIAEVSRLVGLKPDKVRRMINKSLRQLRHLIAHEWEDFESTIQQY